MRAYYRRAGGLACAARGRFSAHRYRRRSAGKHQSVRQRYAQFDRGAGRLRAGRLVSKAWRMACTAARSAASALPWPMVRAEAMAAASTTWTKSPKRSRSIRLWGLTCLGARIANLNQRGEAAHSGKPGVCPTQNRNVPRDANMAFVAMLMAGLDGGWRRFPMPSSLEEALGALEDDHAFLLKGGAFSEELLATYIGYKQERSRRDPSASASLIRTSHNRPDDVAHAPTRAVSRLFPTLRRAATQRSETERRQEWRGGTQSACATTSPTNVCEKCGLGVAAP